MKKLLRINEDGLFVEDVLVELVPMIDGEIDEEGNMTQVPDPLYISTPCSGGFYHPKWDGTQWVEGGKPNAESIINDKILKASQECEARIYAGFESDCLGETKHFDCQDTDQATINGLATVAMAGLMGLTTEETHWKGTGELECYKFEYAQTMNLALDLKRHIESNLNQFNAERLAIISEHSG